MIPQSEEMGHRMREKKRLEKTIVLYAMRRDSLVAGSVVTIVTFGTTCTAPM